MDIHPDATRQAFHDGHGAQCWRWLGAHPPLEAGGPWHFAVWAPAAEGVAVIGDWNGWQPHWLQRDGAIWHGTLHGPAEGHLYKLRVVDVHGLAVDRADPFARAAELRPGTASRLVGHPRHQWRDGAWMHERALRHRPDHPMSIYELHVGSWRSWDGRPLGYAELAQPLIDHLRHLQFSHVELLPVTEFPYDPSWGYQVTGYFAPTARYGSADDLRSLIDQLHQAGFGVLIDWVPGHFPRDGHGLGRFDGTPLYEHPDPRRGEHPDWGTWIFDYGRPEVRSFLLASLHHWLHAFHVDGVRVDAVASMLYLDYSRSPGQWLPNADGGNWNHDAIGLLQAMNYMVRRDFDGVLTIAEESTTFPQVTAPVGEGGLGFSYKWNMGWMNDTLRYFGVDPLYRSWHHDWITFSSTYAFSEAFVLPLSHDEVVHGKGSLVRKMGGRWEDGLAQLRLLYGFQWLHPGKKLLFMGQEFGQPREWDHDRELDWHLLGEPLHRGMMAWVAALNRLYRSHPALALDCTPDGFAWVEGSDRDCSVLVWQRRGRNGESLVAVLHFTPLERSQHWLPVPEVGNWRVLLCSDASEFGGQRGELPQVGLAVEMWGRPHLSIDLPGYAVLVLERQADE